MSTVAKERVTPEEYLRRERVAETKSEYDDGVVIAMSGGSEWHNLIVGGLVRSLGNRLPARCRVNPSDMRVQVSSRRYFYPDVSVVCGTSRLIGTDNLLNPVIVFEVLSDSTVALDRGRKFLAYQTIESLQEYVLLSQDDYLVEHYRRDDQQWLYTVARGVDATLPLPAAECELPLREIYYQVDLASDDSQ